MLGTITVSYPRNFGQNLRPLAFWWDSLIGTKAALGKDHPDTLTNIHSMAVVFDSQGEYKKALEWYQRALVGTKAALGEDHPDTLSTSNNMLAACFSSGTTSLL